MAADISGMFNEMARVRRVRLAVGGDDQDIVERERLPDAGSVGCDVGGHGE
jgi:hypothetical protein